MAKWANDSVLDALLDKASTGNRVIVCAGQPTDRADATAKELAGISVTGADFTKSNGDFGGRKVTIAQKANVPITGNGTADHIAVVDTNNLLYVTTSNTQELTTGNTVTLPSWAVTVSPS